MRDEAAIAGSEGKEIFSERKGLNFFQNKVSCSGGVWEAARRAGLHAHDALGGTGLAMWCRPHAGSAGCS